MTNNDHGYLELSLARLEKRVRRLEVRAEAVAEAIRLLARGLEEGPLTEPGGRTVADAARRAHELLIVTESDRRRPERTAGG